MAMRYKTLLSALIVIAPIGSALASASAATAVTQVNGSAPAPALHFKGGRWFDGVRFVAADWYAVDGRLTHKQPARVDATVNLADRWVMPPLAEAHNHDLQNAFFAARSAPSYISRGIFYSAQLCANPEDIRSFRGFLGGLATPDTIFAEACISSSDGHPLGIALASAKQAGYALRAEEVRDKGYWAVDSLADLDARWARIAAARPAIVKIILIDSANYAANRKLPELFGFNGLDPALVPEIVRRSHALHARVAAHVDTADDFAAAVSSGVDIIAHLPGYRIAKGKTGADYRITDAAIGDAAKRKTLIITTVAAAKYDIEAHRAHAGPITTDYIDNIRRLRSAGVNLLVGSDAIDGSVIEEIGAIDRLTVMSRSELLRIATMVTPRALFPTRDIGRFAEGAEASLVAFGSNPIADIAVLGRPQLLVKQGTILSPHH